jgi:hypothetical protein
MFGTKNNSLSVCRINSCIWYLKYIQAHDLIFLDNIVCIQGTIFWRTHDILILVLNNVTIVSSN